jgi:hypothetical protein
MSFNIFLSLLITYSSALSLAKSVVIFYYFFKEKVFIKLN